LTVGGHRIQPAIRGALEALGAASEHAGFFEKVLFETASFDNRFRQLRTKRLLQWGRTTCFDLLLRAGELGIGGTAYAPEIAYLADSTGPKAGFEKLWGYELSKQLAPWAEGLLQAWHLNWEAVARIVGVRWIGDPYSPGDLENALCIYQHRPRQHRC
jgi:hypothetical protein